MQDVYSLSLEAEDAGFSAAGDYVEDVARRRLLREMFAHLLLSLS